MAFRKSLSLTIKIGLWLGFGYILLLFTFHFCQGNEPNFDLGDGYWLNRWPGSLVHWVSSEDKDWEGVLREWVTGFHIDDPWVVGKTPTAWFAVHKVKHETHYPLTSIHDVTRITGLAVTESDLVTDPTGSLWFPSPYELIWPWTKKYVILVGVVYLVVSLTFWLAIRTSRQRVDSTRE